MSLMYFILTSHFFLFSTDYRLRLLHNAKLELHSEVLKVDIHYIDLVMLIDKMNFVESFNTGFG